MSGRTTLQLRAEDLEPVCAATTIVFRRAVPAKQNSFAASPTAHSVISSPMPHKELLHHGSSRVFEFMTI